MVLCDSVRMFKAVIFDYGSVLTDGDVAQVFRGMSEAPHCGWAQTVNSSRGVTLMLAQL